jgi:hypothetical protein
MIINDARYSDLKFIGGWLSKEDKRELSLTRDVADIDGLALDAFASPIKKVAWDGLFPIMAFGVKLYELEHDTALVWGFKSEEGYRAIRAVTKYIRHTIIPELRAIGVRHAVCLVHPENRSSQKWLAHLGFQLRATYQGIGTRREDLLLYRRDEWDAVH